MRRAGGVGIWRGRHSRGRCMRRLAPLGLPGTRRARRCVRTVHRAQRNLGSRSCGRSPAALPMPGGRSSHAGRGLGWGSKRVAVTAPALRQCRSTLRARLLWSAPKAGRARVGAHPRRRHSGEWHPDVLQAGGQRARQRNDARGAARRCRVGRRARGRVARQKQHQARAVHLSPEADCIRGRERRCQLLARGSRGCRTGRWTSNGSCRPSAKLASMIALLPSTCTPAHAPVQRAD